MVKSSNRRAPLLAAAPGPAGLAGEAWGDAPAGGGAPPPAELDLALALALALVVVTAALVAGAEAAEAELDDDDDDAMPAWMDGDADTAAESMVTTATGIFGNS